MKELGAKTESGVLLDRFSSSKEARAAFEVLETSAKRFQEQADPQRKSVLEAASAGNRQTVAELATIFRENTFSDIDKLELPSHKLVVESRARLDAATTRRFTFGSEGATRQSMGESPAGESGEEGGSPAETPAWHDLGRADVRAILRARQKELYQLLCRCFFEMGPEDLKSQIFDYLSKKQGTPRARGDRRMRKAIKKRVFATAPPSDVLGDVLKHLDEVAKLTDFPTIIRKVAAFGDCYPQEVNSHFYNSVLYYYVFGTEVVNFNGGRRIRVALGQWPEFEEMGGAGVRLDLGRGLGLNGEIESGPGQSSKATKVRKDALGGIIDAVEIAESQGQRGRLQLSGDGQGPPTQSVRRYVFQLWEPGPQST